MVVAVPALPDMAIPKWGNVEDGIKYVGVRVKKDALLDVVAKDFKFPHSTISRVNTGGD